MQIRTACFGLVPTAGGLSRFDPKTEQFTVYTENNSGLSNNAVYAALPDDHGNLWLSTNAGVCKFNPQLNTFKVYDVDDGLQAGTMVAATNSLFNSLAHMPHPVPILAETSHALKGMGFHNMYMAMTIAKFKERHMRLATAGPRMTM